MLPLEGLIEAAVIILVLCAPIWVMTWLKHRSDKRGER